MNVVVVNMCLTYLPSFVVRLMKQFECTRTRRFGISVIVGIYCDMNPSGMTSCLKLQQLAEVRPNSHKMLLRIHCKLKSVQAESSLPPRPQGRHNAKKRRAKGYAETSSSSPAVEMLQKMHEMGQ